MRPIKQKNHISKQFNSFRLGLIPIAGLLWQLYACSLTPPEVSDQEQTAKVTEFTAQGGYQSRQFHALKTSHDTWHLDNITVDISLTTPDSPGVFPTIIYFPGLGESVDAGELWRQVWAHAGYAVISLQLAELRVATRDLEQVNREELEKSEQKQELLDRVRALRQSDLHYIGREKFSTPALNKRLQQIAVALAELKQRTLTKTSPYAIADLSRLSFAGYDLGSQTTAAIMGEHIGFEPPKFAGLKPAAAIIISPFVDLSEGDDPKRFKNIKQPILLVASKTDEDPYGISSPTVRLAFWQYLSGGNQYLLLLKSANHRLLAGANLNKAQNKTKADNDIDEEDFKITPGFFDNLVGGNQPPPTRPNRQNDYKQIATIQCVSLAFLDAIIKSDEVAKRWLKEGATQWVGRSGALKEK
ncbi:MAG: hypothetical protein WC782_01920 [Methylococcaceae bacterium]|jgi:hypothetical protein